MTSPADKLKAEGNKMFAVGKYAAAAVAYGDALMLIPVPPPVDVAPTASVLSSNRAMAQKMLGRWDLVEEDAARAVDWDRFNAKGHWLRGLCLCRKQNWVEGLAALCKARDMAGRQKKQHSLLLEFDAAIAAARYEWHAASVEAETKADEALKAVLLDALDARRERNEARLRSALHGGGSGAPEGSGGKGGAQWCPAPPVSSPPSPPRPAPALRRYSSLALSPLEAVSERGEWSPGLSPGEGLEASDALVRAAQAEEDADRIMQGPGCASSLVQHLLASGGGVGGEGEAAPAPPAQAHSDGGSPSNPPPAGAAEGGGVNRAAASHPGHSPTVAQPAPAAHAAPTPLLPHALASALDADLSHYMACVEQMMGEREATRRSKDIPEAFLCGITLDVMLDPVVTPDGHSYEKVAIETCLRSGKAEDPRTRKPLTLAQLFPNLALKETIHAWLGRHPWAHPRLPLDASTGKVSTSASPGGAGGEGPPPRPER